MNKNFLKYISALIGVFVLLIIYLSTVGIETEKFNKQIQGLVKQKNHELDINWLGMPQEGFGFSNNPSIGFSAPTYDKCNFMIEEGQTLGVPIELIYL